MIWDSGQDRTHMHITHDRNFVSGNLITMRFVCIFALLLCTFCVSYLYHHVLLILGDYLATAFRLSLWPFFFFDSQNAFHFVFIAFLVLISGLVLCLFYWFFTLTHHLNFATVSLKKCRLRRIRHHFSLTCSSHSFADVGGRILPIFFIDL